MTDATREYFKQQAVEAREIAARSMNDIARNNWIAIAQGWERLNDDTIPLGSTTRANSDTPPTAEPEE